MKFVVTIDTEEEWDWDAGFPVRNSSVNNILKLERFHELCQRFNVATTYFVNHPVLVEDSAASIIQEFARTPRTEIGMHVHPWATPPKVGEDELVAYSFLENLPADVANQKLQITYQLLRERGFRPTSFRGGRYSSGPVTWQFLLEHGFRADASICPYSSWADVGAPDYGSEGVLPRQIRHDRISDDIATLWSIPLTRVYSRTPHYFWNAVTSGIEESWLRRLKLIGAMDVLGLVRRIWLNFETESVSRMKWLVIHASRLQLPYLCFTVHSSSLSVGPNPYARTSTDVDRIMDGIEQIFQLMQDRGNYATCTVTELVEQLEQ
ncbi:hypothetical protein [Planctomycetes bacterium TBK1r]|uniref:WalW protein n=1 Tax=Stieleria magnilauensis TaxID=2527963 RepID=A0ABX5XPK4_9BACT|nr:hypothetical protein TBK1r_18320 [Planctomycetes bacterium TBK1r]